MVFLVLFNLLFVLPKLLVYLRLSLQFEVLIKPARKDLKVPIHFLVGLGTYFTTTNVNTQAIKLIHLARSQIVGLWVVVGWLVGGMHLISRIWGIVF